jgi:hypothetical protein
VRPTKTDYPVDRFSAFIRLSRNRSHIKPKQPRIGNVLSTQPILYTTIKTVVNNFQLVIIPTDGKRPHKRAGRTIRRFWKSPPSQTHIETWFSDHHIKSYGILCGRISDNLFILDFDNITEYKNFKRKFDKIAETLTVRTKRGYHVYLRANKAVKTQKIHGGDLQGEGSYAIGPGSTIQEHQYEIETYQPIYKITQGELKKLLDTISLPSEIQLQDNYIANRPDKNDLTVEKMIRQFKRLLKTKGRNKALYQVSNTAKALKIPLQQIMQPLTDAYADAKPQWRHQPETKSTRVREAQRTIQSAYKRVFNKQKTREGLLPTAIREEMIKATAIKNNDGIQVKGSTIPGRFLEALLREGINAGNTFTIKEAQTIGIKYRISTKSIYTILRQELGNTPSGERVFRIVKQSSHVGNTDKRTINKDYNSVNLSGRKTHFRFEMPSIEALCSMYKVIPQSWDSLEPEDLMSSKAYKEAIHREYIRRCSPEQSVTYMANRLGCHPRTIYRYDTNLNVKTIPIFGFIPLTWANVDDPNLYGDLRPDGITQGKWLQRPDGKRFPLVKGIAVHQLSQGKTLVACERRPSRRQLAQSESEMPLFDVIWRRSDLPVGEWDVGGCPAVLPVLGPDITASITTNHERVNVPEPKHPNPKQTGDKLTLVRSQQKRPVLHPMLNHSLTLIPGIGSSRQNKLCELGISTLEDLVHADPYLLVTAHWYGGYVTLHTVNHWQDEAAILLGWRERDPASIEMQRQQCAIRTYRKCLKRLMKFVDKTTTLINSIFPIEDLPNVEPTCTYLKLKTLDWLSKHKDSLFYQTSRNNELHQLASNFFTFYRGYIDNMLSLQDWELEEYGFGNHAFWKRQKKRLDQMEAQFQSISLIDV